MEYEEKKSSMHGHIKQYLKTTFKIIYTKLKQYMLTECAYGELYLCKRNGEINKLNVHSHRPL